MGKIKKKTGIDYLDRMSPEERKTAFRNLKIFHASKTPEERAATIAAVQEDIRKKRRENPLLTANMSDKDIARAHINSIDFEWMKQKLIELAERTGNYQMAADLKRRKLLVDTFEIKLKNEETGEEITM